MSREVLQDHDRMLGAMVMQCDVVDVNTSTGMVRLAGRDGWQSPWVRWHSQAAGKARHWRAPSVGERGTLLCPSGVPQAGRFIPGQFGAFAAPDDRDHVEVWEFEDGGRLVYDWQAKRYSISVPTGTVDITVGSSQAVITDDAAQVKAASITLTGEVKIAGTLHVTGNINSDASIIDTTGNTPNHKH